MTKKIRNRLDLTYRLLKETEWETISQEESNEVLRYIIDTPTPYLMENKVLRDRIFTVFGQEGFLNFIDPNMHEEIREFVLTLKVYASRDSFYDFVCLAAEVVIPNKFKTGRHIEVLSLIHI